MIFDFFRKQKEFEKKKKTTCFLINSLNVPDNQKKLFLEALNMLDKDWLDIMYEELTQFIKKIEMNRLEDISKNNYINVAWMQKKEAIQKQKDINAFSFLINNI